MGFKFSLLLLALMAAGGWGAKMYIDNQAAIIEEQRRILAAQEVREQEQVRTIEQLQTNLQVQTQALTDMQSKNNEIQIEMNRYLDIFNRHNLTKLAAAKPGLIETRANNATKEVFDAIEADSAELSGFNVNP